MSDDKDYSKRLLGFIERHNIKAELIRFDTLVDHKENVLEAIKNMDIDFSDIVKTVVFIDKDKPIDMGNGTVAIVQATSRVDKNKIKAICNARIKIAGPDEVLRLTGYPAGGVPPFGFEAKFYIDKVLASKQGTIYAGGGELDMLMKTSIKEILRNSKPVPQDITDQKKQNL